MSERENKKDILSVAKISEIDSSDSTLSKNDIVSFRNRLMRSKLGEDKFREVVVRTKNEGEGGNTIERIHDNLAKELQEKGEERL